MTLSQSKKLGELIKLKAVICEVFFRRPFSFNLKPYLVLKTNNTQENSKSNPVMNEIGKYSAEDFNMCTTKVSPI